MKYSGGLVKKEREEIFRLFLDKSRLRFNEIEKALNLRSNMVSYHLERMQKDGLIEKYGLYYTLTKNAERYIPIFPNIIGAELSPLPIVLVAVIHKRRILLFQREKRPYKGYWSLIGGRMRLEETLKAASFRQVKEKASIESEYISVNAVLHEIIKESEIIKHSFILFFIKASTKSTDFKETMNGKLKWFEINRIEKQKIIPSDLWLIKNKLNSKIDIRFVSITEKSGKVSRAKVLNKK